MDRRSQESPRTLSNGAGNELNAKSFKARGRPRNGHHSHATKTVLESLARIAVSKNINSSEFFNSLVDAWKQKESTCENLVIRCRKRTRDSAIFLFTIGQKVVAQFPVPEHILQEKNPLKGYIDTMPSEAFSAKNPTVKNPRIRDLEQRMKKVNLKARVLEIPEPKPVYTKFGTQAYVSNVLIADETGTIRLSLWNQQINKVSVDDVIKIENAKVARFRGKRQLRLGRSGKLSVIEGFFVNNKQR